MRPSSPYALNVRTNISWTSRSVDKSVVNALSSMCLDANSTICPKTKTRHAQPTWWNQIYTHYIRTRNQCFLFSFGVFGADYGKEQTRKLFEAELLGRTSPADAVNP